VPGCFSGSERDCESERCTQADLTGCISFTEGKRAYSVGTSSSSSSSLAKYKCDWLSAGAVVVAVCGDGGRPWGVSSSNSSLKQYRALVVLVMREHV